MKNKRCANNAPTITGEIPANTSTGIGLTPVCNVTVNDADGDSLNVTFWENTTGSYVMSSNKHIAVITSFLMLFTLMILSYRN